ncbi:DB module, partial [Ostertagia ostertagi]
RNAPRNIASRGILIDVHGKDHELVTVTYDVRLYASCGTKENNYQPCTSKSIANKLFKSCCDMYVPEECHFMCNYEADQSRAREMLHDSPSEEKRCSIRNRDNRKCCEDLDLNATQLQVGSRCLRMCDPSGTAVERMTKEDITCLYNWNVIMYCHHAGIREM